MNMLMFFVDDLRPEPGCNGSKTIKLSNIDLRASRSVLFERAYCQQAVCAPSLASLMSGLRPDSTGIYDLGHPLRRASPEAENLSKWFKKRGYVTARFGKVYHHESDDASFWTETPRLATDDYCVHRTKEAKQKELEIAQAKGLKGLPLYFATRGPSSEAADVPESDNSISYPFYYLSFFGQSDNPQ